jgi:hypothetical protein
MIEGEKKKTMKPILKKKLKGGVEKN